MPSEQNLQLLLTVPVLLAALCSAGPVTGHNAADPLETSGLEMEETMGGLQCYKVHKIAELLLLSITKLRDDQFQREFGEPVRNMTNYEPVKTEMPLIRTEDRCRPRNFSGPVCLEQINVGLRTYKGHLGYLEKNNLTAASLPDIKQWISILVNTLGTKVEDTHVQSNSSSTLKDDSAWNQKTYTHSILYNLTVFLKDANRAIKYMCGKGFDYVKWPSEKHQQQ